jgi:hypothetical protein
MLDKFESIMTDRKEATVSAGTVEGLLYPVKPQR